MRVRIDPDVCISAGNCVLAAPQVFDQDEDGVVELLDQSPSADQHSAVRDAAQRCPAAVIAVEGE